MLSAAGYGCSVAGSARHRACDPYERRDDAMVSFRAYTRIRCGTTPSRATPSVLTSAEATPTGLITEGVKDFTYGTIPEPRSGGSGVGASRPPRKRAFFDAYQAASAIERAAICRREWIYSSLFSNWRKQRASRAPLAAKRGRKPDPDAVEMTRLQKRNALLEEKLAKANQVISIQGKVYALLRACASESADQLDLPPWNKRSPT